MTFPSDLPNTSSKEYFDEDQHTIDVFERKYAMVKSDLTRETPSEVYWRVASYIASAEPNRELQIKKSYDWFWMLYNREFIPGGRILYGAGRPGKTSLINCTSFGLEYDRDGKKIEADSIEAIYEGAYMIGKVQSRGEGVGLDISKLRPKGARTNNAAGSSTGAVSWMELFSLTTGTIAQEGRRGALMLTIDDWHPDVEEFIKIKSDLTKVNFANISIKLSDAFMNAYKEDTDWELKWPEINSHILYKKSAKDIMRDIAKNAYFYAEPGLLYWDTSVKHSNSDQVGFPVVCVNACSEQVLSHGSSCTLSNVNLSNLPTREKESLLKAVTRRAREVLHFLDNVVECQIRDNRSPLPVQHNDLINLRRVGVGYTGLADLFIKQGIKYDSQEASDLAEEVTKALCYGAYDKSLELGKRRGSYKAFDNYDKNQQHPLFNSLFIKRLLDEGMFTKEQFLNGIRNVCCLTIPPVGTGAIVLQGSSGVEPIMEAWYYRRTRVNADNYPLEWRWRLVIHPSVRTYIRDTTGVDVETLETDEEKISKVEEVFPEGEIKTAYNIDWRNKIKMMGRIQKYIDSSVSVTYNLNGEKTTPKDIEEIYVSAWENGLKGCSVYVENDSNRVGIILFRKRPTELPEEYRFNFSKDYIEKYGDEYAL